MDVKKTKEISNKLQREVQLANSGLKVYTGMQAGKDLTGCRWIPIDMMGDGCIWCTQPDGSEKTYC